MSAARLYVAGRIDSNVGTVDLSAWCGGSGSAEITGYRCNPSHKYGELRDRAGLAFHTGAVTMSFNCTREELIALSQLLSDMAETIPAHAEAA